ncbi:DUF614 domain protein [Rutstroemia sp. NJR-2017a BBW]|nr:DUF614 domain protein [Rutstroemia sp. NJR-2017a BBW]
MAAERPYENSFWACCSPCGLCWKTACCPCFVYGRNHHRLTHGNDSDYSSCNGACCGWYTLSIFGCGFIMQMMDRSTLQSRYRRTGNGCTGCMGSCCCACCEIMQTSKELDYILVENSGLPPQGYKKTEAMVAGPPGYN